LLFALHEHLARRDRLGDLIDDGDRSSRGNIGQIKFSGHDAGKSCQIRLLQNSRLRAHDLVRVLGHDHGIDNETVDIGINRSRVTYLLTRLLHRNRLVATQTDVEKLGVVGPLQVYVSARRITCQCLLLNRIPGRVARSSLGQ
jgi:hypothetical protein